MRGSGVRERLAFDARVGDLTRQVRLLAQRERSCRSRFEWLVAVSVWHRARCVKRRDRCVSCWRSFGTTPSRRAEYLLEQARETAQTTLGADHADTLSAMHRLAESHGNQGRYEEAERLYLETLEGRRQVLGEEDPHTLETLAGLAPCPRRQRHTGLPGGNDHGDPRHRPPVRRRRGGVDRPDGYHPEGRLEGATHRGRGI